MRLSRCNVLAVDLFSICPTTAAIGVGPWHLTFGPRARVATRRADEVVDANGMPVSGLGDGCSPWSNSAQRVAQEEISAAVQHSHP